jgi:hypothetical protein
MNYKIRITEDNQAIVKRIADENGMNPNDFKFDTEVYLYEIQNNKFVYVGTIQKGEGETILTTDQFIELFDKKETEMDRIANVLARVNKPTQETELDKWLRETKAKNLSLEELKNYMFSTKTNIDFVELRNSLGLKYGESLSQALLNQWNNTEESPKVETEPHICKYCQAETTQDDETCYAKPTEWQPKRGDRVLVFDYENVEPLNAIYLETVIGCTQPFLVVDAESEESFLKGNEFDFVTYKHMKPLPIEQPKEDKVVEAAKRLCELQEGTYTPQHKVTYQHGFIDGAKWQLEQPKETDFKSKVIELIEGKINDLKGYEKRQIERNEYYNNHSQVASKIKVYNDLINDIKQL